MTANVNTIPVLEYRQRKLESQLKDLQKQIVHQDNIIFEMRSLLQSGKGLSNILNLTILLDTFMAVVREQYGLVNSAVLLKDDLIPEREFFQIKSFYGVPHEFTSKDGHVDSLFLYKFPKNNGLLWQLIEQGNVFSVRNLQKEPRFRVTWEEWGLDILGSDTWCPLIKSGQVLGILTLGEKVDGTQIQDYEYSFLQELSSIVTTNIDSTLKYEKNTLILSNIQTLYDINQQLTNVNDFKKLCIETLSGAVKAVKAEKGNLMLFNKETNKLEIRVVWGNLPAHVVEEINSGLAETKTFDLGEGIAGQCAVEKKPIRMNEREKIPQVGKNLVHCIMSIPVMNGTVLEGVINMTNKVKIIDGNEHLDPLGRFTEEDLVLLTGLADQAATSLQKARLYTKSITDRMTGLHNTRHFEDMFLHETDLSIAENKPLCLAISDIDHFKKFNDTHGHKAGDLVLQVVAKVFQSCIRPGKGDMVFRYGGEEFCMLLPNTTPDVAALVLEEFRDKIEKTVVEYEGKELRVTCSIGISCTLYESNEKNALFNFADETLYVCKEGGRNQVRAYLGGLNLKPHDITPAIMAAYYTHSAKNAAEKEAANLEEKAQKEAAENAAFKAAAPKPAPNAAPKQNEIKVVANAKKPAA